MARRRRRGVNPQDLTTARAEARLRFDPERAALSALLDQAKGEFRTDVRSADALARTTIRGARGSRPLLKRIYRQAGRGVKVAQEDVERAFNQGGVTPDNAFKLASEAESTAYRQKMKAEAAGARRETVRDVHDAQIGRIFARGAARDRYNANLQQFSDRLRDLGDQEGAYVVSRLASLGEQRAGRGTQLAVAKQYGRNERAAGQTQKEIAQIYAGGGGATGGKPATRAELRSFKTNFAKALSYGRDYARGDDPRSAAALGLRRGVPASKDRKGRSVPGIPAIGDQLAIGAALDMAYDGRVSRANAKALRKIGIRVADLPGAKSYKQWRRRTKADQLRASQNTARQYGQGLLY